MLAPREKLWPASDAIVDAALSMLALCESDVLADYGCGNGVALFGALRAGCRRAVGVEIHEQRATELQQKVIDLGLQDRISVKAGNALDANPSEPTAVYLYLIARGLGMILPLLREIARCQPTDSLRVVTVLYRIPDVQHVRMQKVITSAIAMTPVYLYHITPDSGLRPLPGTASPTTSSELDAAAGSVPSTTIDQSSSASAGPAIDPPPAASAAASGT